MSLHYCHCVMFTASGLLTHCDVPPLLSLCYVYCLSATDSLRCPSTTVTVLLLWATAYCHGHCVMFTASGLLTHCDVPPLLSLCYVYCLSATDSLRCPCTTVTVLRLLPAGLLTHCDVPPLLSLCYVYCLWATDSLQCPSTTVTVLRLLPLGY